MTKIKIDGVEIDEEKLRQIIKDNPQLIAKESGRVEIGRKSWIIDSSGEVYDDTDDRTETDDYRYNSGNYFLTQELAETYKARNEAVVRVKRAIIEANDGGKGDWGDIVQRKYCFYLNDKEVLCVGSYSGKYQTEIPHTKSREIAEKILADYKADLQLIYG